VECARITYIADACTMVCVIQTSNIFSLVHISSLVSGNPFYMKTAISTVRRRVAMFGTTLMIQLKILNIDY